MNRLAILFGVAISIVTLPSEMLAQRGYTARTAEYMAASSDLVVRAVISNLDFHQFKPNDEVSPAAARNLEVATVVLSVNRCLKGTTDDCIRIKITQTVGDPRFKEWKASKTNLFWFFNIEDANKNGITKIAPRVDRRFWESVVQPPDLTATRPPIMLLNVNFEALTTEKMIEDTIVRYVKRFGKTRSEGIRISISPEIAARSGQRQAANYLLLPPNYKELKSK